MESIVEERVSLTKIPVDTKRKGTSSTTGCRKRRIGNERRGFIISVYT